MTDGGVDVTASATYQWQLNGSTISTASSYTPLEADEGKTLQVVVSYSDPGNTGGIESITKSAGTIQDSADLTATLSGLTTGNAVQGTAAVVGTVTDGGVDVTASATYQWQLNGSTISTASSYTPLEADEGKTLQVVVSYSDPGNTGGIESITKSAGTIQEISLMPTITNGTNTAGNPSGTATFNVIFAESMTGMTTADFTLFSTGTGTITGDTIAAVSGAGTTYSVTVTYPDRGSGSHKGQSLGLNFVNTSNVHDTETGETANLAVATNITVPQFPAPPGLLPAGVAGQAIDLALPNSSPDPSDMITVIISGAASDWGLNAGTHNGDGTWTVMTSDPAALAITPAATFTGAMLLGVTESWTNPDGSTASTFITDNVEAYAPGAPIFAVSSNDTLTGAGGNDLFVFAQPIGNDTIYNFNAASDKIDLIGFNTVTSFSDIKTHLTDDANGNALITLGDGESITLHGVNAELLTASDFVFDQTPVTDNVGTMTIGDGAMLPLSGSIDNTGTIALNSTGDETDLQLIGHGITLTGGGQLILSDNNQNFISGTDATVTLTNVDNTISGAGHLGNGQLILVNAGTIDANGTNPLVIDTGSNAVVNSGTLEATGSGGLTVDSNVVNSGTIWANEGNVAIHGDVSGHGSAAISGNATLEFAGADSGSVTFQSSTGTLQLDHSSSFTGTISGFGGDGTLAGSDHIDLSDINYNALEQIIASHSAAQPSYTDGVLAVSDGTHTADIHFLGSYQLGNFKFADDGHGGSIVYDPPIADPSSADPSSADADAGATAGGADTFAFEPDLAHNLAGEAKMLADAGQIDHTFFSGLLDDLYHDTAHTTASGNNDPLGALLQAGKDQALKSALTGTNSPADHDGLNPLTNHGAAGAAGTNGNAAVTSVTNPASDHIWQSHDPFGIGSAGSDSFVFASNFGHQAIADSGHAPDLGTSSHAAVEHIAEILDSAVHDLAVHVETAGATDQVALQTLTKDQLLHHTNDGHFM